MPSVLPTPAAPMTSPSSTSGLRSPMRVLAQQERHEHGEEAGQPPRSAVGAQREGDRRRDAHPGPRVTRRTCGSEPGQQRHRPLAEARVDLVGQPDRPDGGDHEHHEARSAATTRGRARTARRRSAPTRPRRRPRPARSGRWPSPACRSSGTSRGTAAARVTPYALDATSTPSAAGNSHAELRDHRRRQHPAEEGAQRHGAPIAQRRPWLKRSRNGPISGATIAKGSIVRARNSATWPRASPVGTWKNSGAGERDRDRGVAGGVEGVQLDQPGEPEIAGALGARGPARLPAGVPAGAAGDPGRAARHRAPSRGPRAEPAPDGRAEAREAARLVRGPGRPALPRVAGRSWPHPAQWLATVRREGAPT